MTVESELTIPKLGGLRKDTSTRVVEYRTIRYKGVPYDTSTPQGDRTMLLDNDPDGLQFAVATGEYAVRIVSFSPVDGRFTEGVEIVGPAINEADIVRFDGLERWTHRETRPGDYPEIQPGQTLIEPTQQDHGQL